MFLDKDTLARLEKTRNDESKLDKMYKGDTAKIQQAKDYLDKAIYGIKNKYHSGGIVGVENFDDKGFNNYMSSLASNEIPTILQKGEVVLNSQQQGVLSNQMTSGSNISLNFNNVNIGEDFDNIDELLFVSFLPRSS